jgi:hypothetical protein
MLGAEYGTDLWDARLPELPLNEIWDRGIIQTLSDGFRSSWFSCQVSLSSGLGDYELLGCSKSCIGLNAAVNEDLPNASLSIRCT